MNEAKKNLNIESLTPNFMVLETYKTMNKLKAETLDPSLLSWIKKEFPEGLR